MWSEAKLRARSLLDLCGAEDDALAPASMWSEAKLRARSLLDLCGAEDDT